MHIYGAKFQEHCFNISRDIVYSVFYHFYLQTIRHHHWSNLHNRKTSISLKRKKIFQKEKHHSCVFWKVFQISRIYFSCHMHFNDKLKKMFSTSNLALRVEINFLNFFEHFFAFLWNLILLKLLKSSTSFLKQWDLWKYRRMAFFFLKYLFFFLEISTFFYYANEISDDVILFAPKNGKLLNKRYLWKY